MITMAHAGLTRWGKWTRAISGGAGGSLTMSYHRRGPGDEAPDAEYDDPIGELVDRIVAAMPFDLTMTETVLKKKYIGERSNYEIAQYLHVGETTLYAMVNEGHIWVCSYLTALHRTPGCPAEVKQFFNEINQLEQSGIPNGPIKRRTGTKKS